MEENGLYFDDWIEGSSAQLSRMGFVAKRVQDVFGAGTTKVWIKRDLLLAGDMIGNQSLLHYTTVLRIAGYLVFLQDTKDESSDRLFPMV